MKVNKKSTQDKFNIVVEITFDNEDDEQEYIRLLVHNLMRRHSVGVYIKDLDVDIEKYKEYFSCEYLMMEENTPSPVIIAKNLNEETLDNVINNWGFYTLEAYFFILNKDDIRVEDVIWKRDNLVKETVVLLIRQVLDLSVEIVVNQELYYELPIKEINE